MHRPRRIIATSSDSSFVASSTVPPHSSSNATHPRPTPGGNAGLGDANGGAVPPTTIPPTIIGTPTTISSPVLTKIPPSVPPESGSSGSNGVGNPANGGFASTGGTATTSAPPGTVPSSFFPPSITGVNPSGASQSDGAKTVGSTSIDATGPSALRGDSPQTIGASTSPPALTTSTIIPTSSNSHRDMSSGIIVGVIAILISFVLVLAIIRHRKRKTARIEGETSGTRVDRENVATLPIHRQHGESALVFRSPHSPSHTNYAPTLGTPPSPRWLADSNSDVSQLSLPPPPMVEIETRARAVPTLILDTSRYRRSRHSSPVDNRLPVGITPSGDPRRLSRSRRQSPHAGSPISPQSLSPFETFCSSKPPLSFHSSISSSRPSSQTSLRVPPSPTSPRLPPSPTSFRGPPSPRTPPRSPMFIPPIPPLPKSPPPVPESYIYPFVDTNPFDDPF
ncbi:hypothetical protein BJ912DRAFT_985117, partial [Pholiota molesta]